MEISAVQKRVQLLPNLGAPDCKKYEGAIPQLLQDDDIDFPGYVYIFEKT